MFKCSIRAHLTFTKGEAEPELSCSHSAADYDSISGWQIGNSALLAGRQTIVCSSYGCPRLTWRTAPLLRTKNRQGHLTNLPPFSLPFSKYRKKNKKTKTELDACSANLHVCLFYVLFSVCCPWNPQLALKVSWLRHPAVFQGDVPTSTLRDIWHTFHCSTCCSTLNILGNDQ